MRIVLDEFGLFLGRKRNRFAIRRKGKAIEEFPADEVEVIIVGGPGISLSVDALGLAVDKRVQVVFAYKVTARYVMI